MPTDMLLPSEEISQLEHRLKDLISRPSEDRDEKVIHAIDARLGYLYSLLEDYNTLPF